MIPTSLQTILRRTQNPILSALNTFLGLFLLFFFVFIIPWNAAPINLAFSLLGLALTTGGIGLLFQPIRAAALLRITAWAGILVGGLLSLLCLTSMSFLAGIYGGMGKTASGIFLFLILILSILLFLLPGLQLFYLRKLRKQ